MNTRNRRGIGVHERAATARLDPAGPRHGGHGWMVIACCIPMLILAIVLVATGVVGTGFPVAALACTAMAAMMAGMRGDRH